MRIEIVRFEAGRESRRELDVPAGATVRDALVVCGLDRQAEEWIRQSGGIGLGGRMAALDQRLGEGDRIEFLQPLAAGAQELRRERIAVGRRRDRKSPSSG